MELIHAVDLKISIVEGRKDTIPHAEAYALIDIFRSTSTIPLLLRNGASMVVPVFRLNTARAMMKKDPDFIAVGERYGFKIPQFDYGNSPADILKHSFEGKPILFTSTNCTRVLERMRDRDKIFITSFVNFTATYERLIEFDDIALVMSGRPDGSADEDQIFSLFLEQKLKGKDIDPTSFIQMARKSNGARRLKLIGYGRDVIPATTMDTVSFAAVYQDGRIVTAK